MNNDVEDGLLRAFSATVLAFEDLVTINERLARRLRDEAHVDDGELKHIEGQLKAAQERLPVMRTYLNGLSVDVQIH